MPGATHGRMLLHAAAALAALALAAPVTPAAAQDDPRLREGKFVVGCADGTTGTRIACDPKEQSESVRVEKEITIPVKITPRETVACQATMSLEYHQRDTAARVEALIQNAACSASSGEYTIAVTTRDEQGETRVLDFQEFWHRSDDQHVQAIADYPIGENVDLVSVRARRLSCTCDDVPGD
jgi:hypothetical protein